MKKEYVAVGKNVETAIKNGLLEINQKREDVDIKIIEQGGLFKKAKVMLSYDETENVVSQNDDNQVEENIITKLDNQTNEIVEENESIENKLENNTNIEQLDTNEDIKVENVENNSNDLKPEEKNNEKNIEAKEQTEKSIKIVDTSKLKERCLKFLNEFLQKVNINANIDCQEKENEIDFMLTGENVGKLIGFRGESLNALQYLLGCLKESGEGRIHLYLDIDGYKNKREQTLIELANKMADKAEEIERNVHLDPMTPYERRIIHTTLQNRTLVETESTGEGEKRHVVIKFKR